MRTRLQSRRCNIIDFSDYYDELPSNRPFKYKEDTIIDVIAHIVLSSIKWPEFYG